jgi:hypothetical protein
VIRIAAVIVALFGLAGCQEYLTAELASLAVTNRTLADHVISLASGKDCSLVRQQSGLTYCVEDERQVVAQVHCYRTLGSVDCYRQPRPDARPEQELGRFDPNVAAAH